jgi:aminobenzoyl-glutamate utilization protein B
MTKKYANWIKNNIKELLIDVSNKIWEFAELGLEEYKSAKLLVEVLKDHEFSVQEGVADMPTAFVATYGKGKPVIAILGEYDALPGLSQEASPERKVLKQDAPGHGCGHNLLGVGSLGGVLAVKNAIDAGEAKGTIRYYGCPAEETFNSKGYMIAPGGLFEDVDISMTWHPGFITSLNEMSALAMNSVVFKYYGRTAHAAADPQNGRSALDAVELMNIGVNYLREHVIRDARLHYVITKGGVAPNVVPAEAEVWYYIRAPERHQVDELYERVIKIAEGAALMTETRLEIEFLSGMYNTRYSETVGEVIRDKMKRIRAPQFDKEDIEFALELKKSIPKNAMEGFKRFIPPEMKDIAEKVLNEPINNIVLPSLGKGKVMPGSTDVADVSWYTPLAEFSATCSIMGSPGHSWQNVATSGMSIGHKGMLMAAKVLALSAIEFMNNPELVEKARKEFNEQVKDKRYKTPFPEGLKPPHHRIKQKNI